jgi:hypothetical protein
MVAREALRDRRKPMAVFGQSRFRRLARTYKT